jgi:hypothetical protein
LGHVGEKVAVAQHDALRRPLGARGEEHDGWIVARYVTDWAPRSHECLQLRSAANLGLEVVDPKDLVALASKALTTGPSFACSTKARLARTRRMPAVFKAESAGAEPSVGLSIAGTRPMRHSAKSTAGTVATVGKSTPTVSPRSVRLARAGA